MWWWYGAALAATGDEVATAWRLVDYMAVDYADAVADGQVVNAAEYDEMRSFSRDIRDRVARLPDAPPSLAAHADELIALVERKAEAEALRAQARVLGDALLAYHPVPAAPTAPPDPEAGRAVYAQHCASCHGETGGGDGPASAGMDPPPVDFTDPVRARQRSVFALYQVTTQGLEGTPMVGFSQLSDAQRWDVATYVGGLAFDDVASGRALYATAEGRAEVLDLKAWASVSPAQLGARLGEERADALVAHLRAVPAAVGAPTAQRLAVARERVAQAAAAYSRGDTRAATDLALSAYLDGFEPVEPLLVGRGAVLADVERSMNALRAAIQDGDSTERVQAAAQTVDASLARAEEALTDASGSAFAVTAAAALLLLREGVEALLVVIAMLGMVRKLDRPGLVRQVHVGWVSALVAGALTWLAATTLIQVSGAQRELIEGVGGLTAAAVLVGVGVWLHDKSVAGRWQAYIRAQVDRATASGAGLGMVGLIFVVVYREVFETILFLTALWAEAGPGPVLAGVGVGAVGLVGVAWALLQASVKLPLARFFAICGGLLSALAVVLAGKGMAAMQEAGVAPISPVDVPTLAVLGVHGTVETLGAQAITALAVVSGWSWARRGG